MAGNRNSGRRPQPTALRVLRGNPSKERLPEHEPVMPPVDATFDVPPDVLEGDAIACAEWARVAPILRTTRIISEVERGSLIALCQQWSRYLMAQGKVRELGMVIRGSRGEPLVNPFVKISDTALAACLRLWVELGLTPSARSRISALTQVVDPTKDAWAGLLE